MCLLSVDRTFLRFQFEELFWCHYISLKIIFSISFCSILIYGCSRGTRNGSRDGLQTKSRLIGCYVYERIKLSCLIYGIRAKQISTDFAVERVAKKCIFLQKKKPCAQTHLFAYL